MFVKRLVTLAAIIMLAALATPAFAQQDGGCQSLAGSLAANLRIAMIPNPPNDPVPVPEWYGTAFLAIGKAAPLQAALTDKPLRRSKPQPPNGKLGWALWGAEMYILTFADGELYMEVDYMAMFSPAPFMADYNASGKITGGTGEYAGASGNVTVHGPFVALPPGGPVFGHWISELKGVICGVQ